MAKTKTSNNLPQIKAKGNKNIPDFSKDPYFVKKNQEAAEFLKKAGLPKDWGK